MSSESGAALRARRRSDLVQDMRASLDGPPRKPASRPEEGPDGLPMSSSRHEIDEMLQLMEQELHEDSGGGAQLALPPPTSLPPPRRVASGADELQALRSQLEQQRQQIEQYARRIETAEARAKAAERRAAAAEEKARLDATALVPTSDSLEELSLDDPFHEDSRVATKSRVATILRQPARKAAGHRSGPSMLRCILHWINSPVDEAEHLDGLRRSLLGPDAVPTPYLETPKYCRSLSPSGRPVGDGDRNTRGEPHGWGTMILAQGAGYYSGEWHKGNMEGEGRFIAGNGERYVGQFVAGERSGRGVYYYDTGDRYEGEYARGLRHGSGTMYYANGDKCEGRWAAGCTDGTATYTYADGSVEMGRYARGVEVDEGVAWSASRDSAWRMQAGVRAEAIELSLAADIAARLTSAELRKQDDARASQLLASHNFSSPPSPRKSRAAPKRPSIGTGTHTSFHGASPLAICDRSSHARGGAHASPRRPPASGDAEVPAWSPKQNMHRVSSAASVAGASPLVPTASQAAVSCPAASPGFSPVGISPPHSGGPSLSPHEGKASLGQNGVPRAGSCDVAAAAASNIGARGRGASAIPYGHSPPDAACRSVSSDDHAPPASRHLQTPSSTALRTGSTATQILSPSIDSLLHLSPMSTRSALVQSPSPACTRASPLVAGSTPTALSPQMTVGEPQELPSPHTLSNVTPFDEGSAEEAEEMAIIQQLYDAEREALRQSRSPGSPGPRP